MLVGSKGFSPYNLLAERSHGTTNVEFILYLILPTYL